MKFDPVAVVPTNALIQSATLRFSIVHSPAGGAEPSMFALYRLMNDWGKGVQSGTGSGALAITNEVSWNARFHQSLAWAAPGVVGGDDVLAVTSATSALTNAASELIFSSAKQLVADVQAWLNQPNQNNGWLLQSQDEITFGTARRFAAREDPVSYPVLILNYVIPVRIQSVTRVGTNVRLSFVAYSNQAHRVEFSTNLSNAVWQSLTNFPTLPTNRSVAMPDRPSGDQFYFRVVSY